MDLIHGLSVYIIVGLFLEISDRIPNGKFEDSNKSILEVIVEKSSEVSLEGELDVILCGLPEGILCRVLGV